MQPLDAYFTEQASRDIHTLGRYIQQYINDNWDKVFQANRQEMIDRYDEIGDAVYGLYGTRLFRPIHDQLKLVGLRARPRLPGHFDTSREWGDDDSDRERWMWSRIETTDRKSVGTIATAFFHDHIQIRIPRPFRIIALNETAKGDVVAALSRISPEFGAALEARVEYAEYYAAAASGETVESEG